MPTIKAIYGYFTTKKGEDMGVAITEDGVTVAIAHDCDSMQAAALLGMTEGSTNFHETYDAALGVDGWTTEYVDVASQESHEGLQAALAAEIAAQDSDLTAVRELFAGKA